MAKVREIGIVRDLALVARLRAKKKAWLQRIRKIMDLVVSEDPRVRYAEDGEGDAAEPVGEPCDKASANDARSGGGDGVRARATALTDDLAENFEDPEAIQLTTYQPRPQSRAAS